MLFSSLFGIGLRNSSTCMGTKSVHSVNHIGPLCTFLKKADLPFQLTLFETLKSTN